MGPRQPGLHSEATFTSGQANALTARHSTPAYILLTTKPEVAT